MGIVLGIKAKLVGGLNHIYYKHQPNGGRSTTHGYYGIYIIKFYKLDIVPKEYSEH